MDDMEKIFTKLYAIRKPSNRVKRMIDELAMELTGESWSWSDEPKPRIPGAEYIE